MSKRSFGSVRKLQSGRFQASYTAPDGSRVNAPTTFGTKEDAEDWLATVRADKVRGILGKPKGYDLTLSAYVPEWLEHRKLRPSSLSHYQGILRKHILPKLGHLSLMTIEPQTVRRWHSSLSATTGKAMQANAYRLLHSILATATEDELIVRNPVHIKGAREVEAKPRTVMTANEITLVASKMPKRYQTMVLVVTFAALRHGEAIGLRRKDVDLDAGTITVAETLTRVGATWVVGNPKTRAGARTLHLPPTVTAELANYMDTYTGLSPNARVFTTSTGGPIFKQDMRKWLMAAAGRSDIFPHLLRHCGLTMISQVGATSAEILARGGHTSMNVAKIYQHGTAERDRDLASRLDSLLAS